MSTLKRWNGSAWEYIGSAALSAATTVKALTLGASGSVGVSASYAREDHVHSLLNAVLVFSGSLSGYTESMSVTGSSASAVTLTLANGNYIKYSASANCSITTPTITSGQAFTLEIIPGAYTVTFNATPTKYWFGTASNATAPSIDTGKINFFTFLSDNANIYGWKTGSA